MEPPHPLFFESLVFIMSDNVFSLTEGLYNTSGSLTCGFVIGCYGIPPQGSHPACQVGLDVWKDVKIRLYDYLNSQLGPFHKFFSRRTQLWLVDGRESSQKVLWYYFKKHNICWYNKDVLKSLLYLKQKAEASYFWKGFFNLVCHWFIWSVDLSIFGD